MANERDKHRVFTRALQGLPPGEHAIVSKSRLRSLPASYQETILGTPPSLAVPGAVRQFRGPYRRHVYEMSRTWDVHRDATDPREDPVGHLWSDAPEWLVAFLVGGYVGVTVGGSRYDQSVREGHSPSEAKLTGALGGVAAGLLAGRLTLGAAHLLRTWLEDE